MENKTLVQITNNHLRLAFDLISEAQENGGEISERTELEIKENDIELANKVESYYVIIEQMKLQIENLKKKEEQIYSIRKGLESKIKFLETRLKDSMTNMKIDKLEGTEHYFKLSSSKASVFIEDEKAIPSEFKKQIVIPEHIETEIDKEKIREALEMGFHVDGAVYKSVKKMTKGIMRWVKEAQK